MESPLAGPACTIPEAAAKDPPADDLPPELRVRRDLIAAAGGRFCAVTFRRTHGRVRRMRVQPATLARRAKGPLASEPERRAAVTRALRHPHLLPVGDVRARAARSVDLRTVSRVAVDGQVRHVAV